MCALDHLWCGGIQGLAEDSRIEMYFSVRSAFSQQFRMQKTFLLFGESPEPRFSLLLEPGPPSPLMRGRKIAQLLISNRSRTGLSLIHCRWRFTRRFGYFTREKLPFSGPREWFFKLKTGEINFLQPFSPLWLLSSLPYFFNLTLLASKLTISLLALTEKGGDRTLA